jgi:putative ABC transport system substrate-binding protein
VEHVWQIAAGETDMSATEAESADIRRIGILSPMDANGMKDWWDALKDGLRELGYREGKEIAFVSRHADGKLERLPGLASELVQLGVDVIVPATPPAILAAQSATSTIPIVFPVGSDPVETGLVSSYERPGGNTTGVATMSWQLSRPRLALIKELIPAIRKVALIRHSANTALEAQVRESRAGATELGIELVLLELGGARELDEAFKAAKKQGASVLLALSDPLASSNANRIAALSFEYQIPVVSPFTEIVEAGGVLAYGPDLSLLFRRGASLVARILTGAKPGDLSIEQPTEFELVINVKSAETFNLTVPDSLLARATRIIR